MLFIYQSFIVEAAKKVIFLGPGLATKKKELFLSSKKRLSGRAIKKFFFAASLDKQTFIYT